MVSLPTASTLADSKMPFPDKPVIQCSDAHYVEHIARRFFTLDTGNEAIQKPNGEVDLDVLHRALQKLRV
jgi:hypothetical protein